MPSFYFNNNDAWVSWTHAATTTITTDSMWQMWNSLNPATTLVTGAVWSEPERQRALDRYERQQEEARQRRQAAKERARELLKSLLTQEQWESYDTVMGFDVVGSDGVTYRIQHGMIGNVYALYPDGTRRAAYCAHPYEWDAENDCRLPTEDILAGQVLALRTDAPGFVATANVHARWDENGRRTYDLLGGHN